MTFIRSMGSDLTYLPDANLCQTADTNTSTFFAEKNRAVLPHYLLLAPKEAVAYHMVHNSTFPNSLQLQNLLQYPTSSKSKESSIFFIWAPSRSFLTSLARAPTLTSAPVLIANYS